MKLIVDNVTYRYKKREEPVLSGFGATFDRNRIWAITGPNGSGKTTLGKIIMGILKPETGSIVLSGQGATKGLDNGDSQSLTTLTLAEIGRKIGYVMQNPSRQIFSVTVREEMAYGLRNLGLGESEIEQRSREYLNYFQLDGYEETFPLSLSQGEKQRLVLAAVLAMKPDWLLLDEPTASLDLHRRQLLRDYLLRIKEDLGTGLILISHDRTFIEKMGADEVRMGGRQNV